MATKKKIIVKDLLELIPATDKVVVEFYAYGFVYARSDDSGETCDELIKNMNYDCLNAKVTRITETNDNLLIYATLT